MNESKSQPITKEMVWVAYQQVAAKGGSAGIDRVSIKEFEKDLKGNLYKLWNRMTSGSYFPPPVKEVSIPKSNGGVRKLGIPTVGDRIAQMVVKNYLEPILEPHFDVSSYGYRPGRNAHQALAVCRKNCHTYGWVIDLDIKGFFDNMSHELVLKALTKHTDEKWIEMYVSRWLEAPVMTHKGLKQRSKGTPQGGVISPLLANLYLHYAFDKWLRIYHRGVPFERYADDMVVHCRDLSQAESLLKAIQERLQACELEVHPEKTKIVYCKQIRRRLQYPIISFDFLGFTFKPRRTQSRKGFNFQGFSPGVSNKSIQRMNEKIKLRRRHLGMMDKIEEVAVALNPIIEGWIGYYGRFRISDLNRLWEQINHRLILWIRKKYKRVKGSKGKAARWLRQIYDQNPTLFVYWVYLAP